MSITTSPGEVLSIWTVYDHPTDYPEHFVARRSIVDPCGFRATSDMFTADTIDEIRALLPRGLYRLNRHPDDEPQIVEVWL